MNVAVESLAVQLHVREFPCSNTTPYTGCPYCWGFSWFSTLSTDKYWDRNL